MSIRKKSLLKSLFFLPLIFSPILLAYPSLASISEIGVSKFVISASRTYNVEVNFSLTHNSGPGNYLFKFSRLNNREPSNPLTKYCPPYQESSLLQDDIIGYTPGRLFKNQHDRFNNTFDLFESSLFASESAQLFQEYIVRLNAISFEDIQDADIGNYDTSDIIFDLYCNNAEQYYEKDHPDLISTSNSIVDPSDNPVEKAEKIIDWVSDYLTYDETLSVQEMGALWAYNNQIGDCSEYSSLMITLLRIQGIPARKVIGFCISNDPTLETDIGDEWIFTIKNDEPSNLLAHAWVEYYVENIGWIACDPTWHSEINYFNRIDNLRFGLNVGAWFPVPELDPISELSNPYFTYYVGASFDYEYNVKVTVTDQELPDNGDGISIFDLIPGFPVEILFLGIGFGSLVIVVSIKKRNRIKQ